MSSYNTLYWKNPPRRFSRYWWYNQFHGLWDMRDASGDFIWDHNPEKSRYWNWYGNGSP